MKNIILIIITTCAAVLASDYWRPIFNGVDFTGWNPIGPGPLEDGSAFEVTQDSAVWGANLASQPKHGICFSEDEYDDFTVRFTYKCIKGNSGFYFRSEPDPGWLTVAGMHVEVSDAAQSAGVSGGLYETLGRNWVCPMPMSWIDTVERYDDWNDVVLEAYGGHLTVHLNGILSCDLPNDIQSRQRGRFGLQVHGSMDVEVYFKRIHILDSSYCETDAPCVDAGQVCDTRMGSPTKNSCTAGGCPDPVYKEFDPLRAGDDSTFCLTACSNPDYAEYRENRSVDDDGLCVNFVGSAVGKKQAPGLNITHTSGRVTVTFPDKGTYQVSIRDVSGALIRSQSSKNESTMEISMPSTLWGVYSVRVEAGGKKAASKVIILYPAF
jgi:hypothetical protein